MDPVTFATLDTAARRARGTLRDTLTDTVGLLRHALAHNAEPDTVTGLVDRIEDRMRDAHARLDGALQ